MDDQVYGFDRPNPRRTTVFLEKTEDVLDDEHMRDMLLEAVNGAAID